MNPNPSKEAVCSEDLDVFTQIIRSVKESHFKSSFRHIQTGQRKNGKIKISKLNKS